MLTLYDYLDSGNGYKVRLLLAQLGAPYRLVELDIMQGATRTPAFLAKNPNGRVPTLELEDGTFLAESNAIIWYLAEGSTFVPADRLGRAKALHWMFFEQYSHEPNIATLRFWLSIRKVDPDGPEARQIPSKTQAGYAALQVMESHLAKSSYFVGNALSIADIALYAYTHVASEGGFDLERFPAIRQWLARVAQTPGHVEINQTG